MQDLETLDVLTALHYLGEFFAALFEHPQQYEVAAVNSYSYEDKYYGSPIPDSFYHIGGSASII